jgi:hypothetical protein
LVFVVVVVALKSDRLVPRGAHQGFEVEAFALITPAEFQSGAVTSGDLGTPVIFRAIARVRPGADAPAGMLQPISMVEHSRSKLCFAEGVSD